MASLVHVTPTPQIQAPPRRAWALLAAKTAVARLGAAVALIAAVARLGAAVALFRVTATSNA